VISLLVLLACCVGIVWLLSRDVAERPDVSSASWLVLAWACLHASRPVTSWFGDPSAVTAPAGFDEGNLAEAIVNLGLIVAAVGVLARRRLSISAVIAANVCFAVLYVFWLQSVFWSDSPLITIKRLFKDLGNVAMVLVVLSDRNPAETIRAVCVRCAFVCLPLSAVAIRYYPNWGRAYVGYHMNEPMLLGITGHKNTLGILACLAVIFLLWDLLEPGPTRRPGTAHRVATVVVWLMGWYFIVAVDSATALVCAVVGSVLLLTASLSSFQRHPGRIEACGVCALVTAWLFNNFFHLERVFLENLGRDETLTTRTDMWPLLIGLQDQPLLGAGFSTFWSGRRLVETAKAFGGVIIQAHNGYLDTYLNGGLIGLGLLIVLLGVTYRRIRQRLAFGAPDARIRFAILFVALVHNFTEATFHRLSLMWFVTVFAIMEYRAPAAARAQEV
jgi:exopolysaccharide production protein ExoQ